MRILTKKLLTGVLLIFSMSSMAMQSASIGGRAAGAIDAPVARELEVRQGGCLTLSQAVEQVRRQYNGRIVSAETQVRGGREVHIIKVLTSDGTVKTVRIPGCRV